MSYHADKLVIDAQMDAHIDKCGERPYHTKLASGKNLTRTTVTSCLRSPWWEQMSRRQLDSSQTWKKPQSPSQPPPQPQTHAHTLSPLSFPLCLSHSIFTHLGRATNVSGLQIIGDSVRQIVHQNKNIKTQYSESSVKGIHLWSADSSYKGPVMLKTCPCYHIDMQ